MTFLLQRFKDMSEHVAVAFDILAKADLLDLPEEAEDARKEWKDGQKDKVQDSDAETSS